MHFLCINCKRIPVPCEPLPTILVSPLYLSVLEEYTNMIYLCTETEILINILTWFMLLNLWFSVWCRSLINESLKI